MSCPVCGIGANYRPSSKTTERTTTKKGPTTFSTYPPYAGPQDTLTFANERALGYPYIHAKIYNRVPSAAYMELKAQAEKERAREERRSNRPVTRSGGNNSIREAISHLQTATKLLTH